MPNPIPTRSIPPTGSVPPGVRARGELRRLQKLFGHLLPRGPVAWTNPYGGRIVDGRTLSKERRR